MIRVYFNIGKVQLSKPPSPKIPSPLGKAAQSAGNADVWERKVLRAV
jgi:hypothetical protein